MAKKTQTASRRRRKEAVRRVVNYYNHGTVNVDARQNNSTTKRQEYPGCTFNGVAEYDGDYDKSNYVPASVIQASSPETKEKKSSKRTILLMVGTIILMVSACAIPFAKTKK